MRLALFASLLAGLASSAVAKLNILTTTPDLASIAMEVGGNRVSVSSIIVGARDPHRIEAKPSFMSRAAGADLFVAVGLELEIAYEMPIIDGSRNGRIRPGAPGHVYAAEWVKPLDVPSGPVSRAQGDIHPYGNPHIWLDPYNGRVIALRLADKMGSLDKSNASFYASNAKEFVERLDKAMFGAQLVDKFGGTNLWQWENAGTLTSNLAEKGSGGQLGGWAGKMARFRGISIITYHRSFVYFAKRFDLRVADELEPKPGIDPAPGHIAGIIRLVQSQGIKAIVQEPFYSTRNGKFVESRTDAKLVVVPGSVGHDPAARDYISLFDVMVDRISSALGR